jgi:hypothetical protein
MSKTTDLRPPGGGGLTDEQRSTAAEALARTAGHLASQDPKGLVGDEVDFAVLVGAKVHASGACSGAGGGVRIARLALAAVGGVPTGSPRDVFALRVAEAAASLGYDWTADDNRRVIPTIPAPRRGSHDAVRPGGVGR